MKQYADMSPEELRNELATVKTEHADACSSGLKLDLTRGKPNADQLALSNAMMRLPTDADFRMDGTDVRNYGLLGGLPSTKRLFAELLDVEPEEVFVGGNASLALMYDVIAKAYTHGLPHSPKPWSREPVVKFLCPSPGYDRHFHISQSFGMELITIPMQDDGPDMALVEQYVSDPTVKGIWCTPKYSNPDGIVYSEAVCRRIASLRPAAPDFLLMWDNAYCVHAIDGELAEIPNILALCRECGNADMPYMFASTSKITFPGSGVAVLATSIANLAYYKKLTSFQTISYSKVNEYMHVHFLKDKPTVLALMRQHAAILKPKFDAVTDALQAAVAPCGIARWHTPMGGYFISLYAYPHTAKRVYALCADAGVLLTAAGATYPYGDDPDDSNIRIAPSYATLDEVRTAASVLCICIRLAALEALLSGDR